MSILEEETKKIAVTGGSSALYLSSLAREYFNTSDSVDYKVILEGTEIVVRISKKLFNFLLDDLKKVAREFDFRAEYDKTLGEDIQVFDAHKDNFTLSYTQNLRESGSPANVTLSAKLNDIDYHTYKHVIVDTVPYFQTKYNVITRVEGDLEVIKLLKEPEKYKLNQEKAFQELKTAGKQISISIMIRFDNRKNTIEEIKSAISELKN